MATWKDGKTPAQFLMLLCSLCAQNEKTTPTHIKCSFRFVTGKRPRRKLLPTDGRRKRVKKEKKNAMVRQWVWKEQKWDKMVHHLPAIPIVPANVRTCQHHHITTEYQAAILSTKQNTVSWIQLYFKINDDKQKPPTNLLRTLHLHLHATIIRLFQRFHESFSFSTAAISYGLSSAIRIRSSQAHAESKQIRSFSMRSPMPHQKSGRGLLP